MCPSWCVTRAIMKRFSWLWSKTYNVRISIPSRKRTVIGGCRKSFTGARKRWPKKLARVGQPSPTQCACFRFRRKSSKKCRRAIYRQVKREHCSGLHSEPLILSACREVIAKGLSTRETEKLVRHLTSGRKRRRVPLVDPDLRSVVEELQRLLGTRVRLLPKARSAQGKIEIEYYSVPDLDRIIQTIKRNPQLPS